MNIVIKDKVTGKEFMIKGCELDYEIFKRSKGRKGDNEHKGKGGWTTARCYPTTLPAAVCKCVQWCLSNPDDNEEWVAEAKDAYKILDKEIRKRVREIVAEVSDE